MKVKEERTDGDERFVVNYSIKHENNRQNFGGNVTTNNVTILYFAQSSLL